ncbi:MAG TPA: hypothetical protein VF789_09070 [Thermoanaerobaculia bacterium]
MKSFVVTLGALALLLCCTPVFADVAAAPALQPAEGCGASLDQLLAPEQAVCKAPEKAADPMGLEPLMLAAPHCCATGAADACRDSCRLQGPSCKGSIGCRAGECVCTCTC